MKTITTLGLILLFGSANLLWGAPSAGQPDPDKQTILPIPIPYAIKTQDANSRVWEQTTYAKSPAGGVVTNTSSYAELASGLNHLVNGQWLESSENIDILPNGTAAAVNGQHQAYFPGDIYQGQIELVTPDGQQLHSRPMGLSYFDGTNIVLIAVLTNSIGQVLGANQIIYTNAFTSFAADLVYTYTKAGFEQDIVLREQPTTPESLGLNPDTARIQVLTEFFSPPQPTIQSMDMPAQAGVSLMDQSLGFGQMQMIPGRAFLLGQNTQDAGARVGKQWVILDGRQFLVEEVPVDAIAAKLGTLPLPAVQPNSATAAPTVSKNLILPPQRLAKKSTKPMVLAKTAVPSRGLVLDYQTINSNQTNYTFRGDTTYYISGSFYLIGTNNVIEGGAVIKYANNAALVVSPGMTIPAIQFQTSAYRPAIFTAIDDNSVGNTISGSTGHPTNYYANPALDLIAPSFTPNIANFRILYAQQAFNLTSVNPPISNGQIVNCQVGIVGAGATVNLENVLFANVKTNFSSGGGFAVNAQNTTISGGSCLVLGPNSPSGVSLVLTNCILANMASLTNGSLTLSGDINGFYNSPVFGTGQVTNTFYPFQSAGAGNYYLTNGCAFTNAGTTTIDATLLASLKQRTTCPPLLLTNQTISTNITLSPQAQRDTDTPDLGYHYDPLDYLVDNYAITNATLTVTNGAAIASYNETGIQLQDGSAIVSIGSPLYPNWFVRYTSVQEQSALLGGNNVFSGLTVGVLHKGNVAAIGQYLFSKFACPANEGYLLYDSGQSGQSAYNNLLVQNCELWGGLVDFSGNTNTVATLQNNLLDRANFTATTVVPNSLTLSNNLIFGTTAFFYNQFTTNTWQAFNNAFDSSTVTLNQFIPLFGYVSNSYNAYLNCTGHLNPTNATDLYSGSALAYQTGPLGCFYQPTNSPLFNMGSATADQVGLYHFTVTTNEVLEGTNIVSIGYHYVATDTNGIPLDANSDGIPDYTEDANGNGLADTNETPWGVLPTIIITSPTNNGTYFVGTNHTLAITANAQAGPETFIKEVGYYYNVLGSTTLIPICVSTASPFSIVWTNACWTNAFVGTNDITAVARDNTGISATNIAHDITIALDSDGNGLPDYWQMSYFGHLGAVTNADPDNDGFSNLQEFQNGTDPANPDSAPGLLARWHFDNTNWFGAEGQQPLLATNLNLIPSWSSNAMKLSTLDGDLQYNLVEGSGHTNLNLQCGTVRLWFSPNWNSGAGFSPDDYPTLFEVDEPGSYAYWGAYIGNTGENVEFTVYDGTANVVDFGASIFWTSNQWHQIVLTYTATNTIMYIDGSPVATNGGITSIPVLSEFHVGNDDSIYPAYGKFDEMDTFDYPLDAGRIAADYSAVITRDSDTNGLPDFWEINNFGTNGVDPGADPDGDGYNNLQEYQSGFDPNRYDSNIISFSFSVPNQHVKINIVGGAVTSLVGVPFYFATLVDSTNVDSADLSNATWTAYTSSNITVSIGTNEGLHSVWIGLRGYPTNAQRTWQEITFTLDTTPPVIVVTNPVASTVSQPLIQVQGLADEEMSSLTFDISNASGVFTGQTAYVTGEFYDTNLLAFTTNYFQCYNVALSGGLNTITLHATDLAGNTATNSFTVTLDYSGDTTPPMIQLVWPHDGTLISGSNFVLHAWIDDATAQVMTMVVDSTGNTNTVQGSVQQDGTVWAQNLPLAFGTNMVTVTATDSAGNTSVTNFNVIQSAVTLTIDPLTGDQLNKSSVGVSGTVSDPTEVVTVNGVTAIVETNSTWIATNVLVSASGIANIYVQAFPNGSDPSSTPSDGEQHSDEWQPPTVAVFSHELGDNYWENTHLTSFYYCNEDVNPCTDISRTNLYVQDCRQVTTDYEETFWVTGQGGFDRRVSDSPTGLCSDTPDHESSLENVATNAYSGLPQGTFDEYRENTTYGNGDPWTLFAWTRDKFDLETDPGQTGTARIYLVQALMQDGYGGLPFDWFQIRGQTLIASDDANSDGTGWGQTIVTVPAGVTNIDVTPVGGDTLKNHQLAEQSGFQEVYYRFSLQTTQLVLQPSVDANRDGNFAPNTAASPYHFWVNDSNESGDDETSGGADDQIPGQEYFTANYSLIHVHGRSDLVNFFPVVLCLSNTLQQLPPSDGYEYTLVQDESAVKFVYTGLTPENAFDYLTNTASTGYGTNFDEDVTNADTIQIAYAPGAVLDTNWLAQINNGTGVILVEGCVATTKPLWLEIWRDGKLLAGMPLYLSITGAEQMFRHKNLMTSSGGAGGASDRLSGSDVPNEPSTKNANLVFLHGYNVNPQQARGVESEMFKRFYWSGSKARFYGVTWNGSVSQGDVIPKISSNLQTNIVNAFLTAPHLASFLNGLSGDTVVAAHSLGNMVVLSAIGDYSAPIDKYFMIDSAVAIEAIDGGVDNSADMIHSDWTSYANRLYASDWHNLFPTNDARSTLTWRNRLSNLNSVNDVYNFYSSGEDVLRDFSGAPPTDLTSTISEIISEWWNGTSVASFVWVWQEKDKGRMSGNNFISSNHGGWAFAVNTNYYYKDDVHGYENPILGCCYTHLSDLQASLVPDSQLQTNAFFDFSSAFTEGSSSPSGTADLALYSSSGSTYAVANRDRILSDAVPALTLPAGANSVTNLDVLAGEQRNFDMSSPDGVAFSTFQNGWPAARSTGAEALKWHHTDFDYVAYPFTHKLFDEIVNDGNLK